MLFESDLVADCLFSLKENALNLVGKKFHSQKDGRQVLLSESEAENDLVYVTRKVVKGRLPRHLVTW